MSMFDRNILYNLSQAQHFLEDRVRPASTQISMHTRTDLSVFAVGRKALWIFGSPKIYLLGQFRLCGNAGWSESSLGTHAILKETFSPAHLLS